MTWLAQNRKMKKTSKERGLRLFSWGIPAARSETGLVTCPMAGACLKPCYAQAGAYTWSNVRPAFERRLALTQMDNFIPTLIDEIKRVKADVVRIHDSGDFYSLQYLIKWVRIMELVPNVRFYAYTKMVKMLKRYQEIYGLPANFTVIYSYGGLQDSRILLSDRHSQVFLSEEDLLSAGYANASNDDLVAIGDNPKIGLVYHGSKKKEWRTA